jgi:GMP synthase-like glutamine amidotransferase
MHRDIVQGIPDDAIQLGSTDKCANQGMYKKGKYIAVQGHPEFTHDIVEEILEVRNKVGIIPDGDFEEGMRRLKDHDDGVPVAQAFLRFLLED